MTSAQLRILHLLPLDAFGMQMQRVRRDTLQRMSDAGLVKLRPYGKPPHWAITQAGRAAIAKATGSAA